MRQAEKYRGVSRINCNTEWAHRSAAGRAPVRADARAVGLSLHAVTRESAAVPGQGQEVAASGKAQNRGTHRALTAMEPLVSNYPPNSNHPATRENFAKRTLRHNS